MKNDKFIEALFQGIGDFTLTLSVIGFAAIKTEKLEKIREKIKPDKEESLRIMDKLISYKKDFDLFMEELKSKENSDVSNKV